MNKEGKEEKDEVDLARGEKEEESKVASRRE